jgi:hypothetical protein
MPNILNDDLTLCRVDAINHAVIPNAQRSLAPETTFEGFSQSRLLYQGVNPS